MDLGLKGKIIIVTGGSKGIGSGIVSVLLEEGAIPIIVGRDKKTIISAVNKYKERNLEVGFAFAELTDPKQCEQAVKKIINDHNGHISIKSKNGLTEVSINLPIHGTYE